MTPVEFQSVASIRGIAWLLAVVCLEMGLIVVAARLLDALTTRVLRHAAAVKGGAFADSTLALQARVRNILLGASIVLIVATLGYNGWLVARGVNVRAHTAALLTSFAGGMGIGLAFALVKLAAGGLVLLFAVRLVRWALGWTEAALTRWDQLEDNHKGLEVLFLGLDRAVVTFGWMLLAVLACWLLGVPDRIANGLLLLVRAYLVVAIGLMIIRSTVMIVDTLNGVSHRYADTRGWQRHYDQLHPLLPTFRMCLEYAMWIGLASLALAQIRALPSLVGWGPLLIEAITLFFMGRVVIGLGQLEIERRMLPTEGLSETARRRRATIAPLVASTFVYAVYFATAVLILGSLGFNPMPFLAGAGILGLVVGFGAQSLINDVVSGFFILFENTYLVGDVIEAAGAKGVVEAIEFRTTKIRDIEGRVHVIRNGEVKQVVNYSKDYTIAIVSVDVTYDADLRWVFGVLRAAGERIRAEHGDVLGDTQIDGISAFGVTTMTVRTSTRVRPGRHEAVAAALRLAIKEAFDDHASGGPRKGLVPEMATSLAAGHHH